MYLVLSAYQGQGQYTIQEVETLSEVQEIVIDKLKSGDDVRIARPVEFDFKLTIKEPAERKPVLEDKVDPRRKSQTEEAKDEAPKDPAK